MANIEEDEPADTGGWINTFADLMNLLLCFFVLLFSMSTVDADKYEQLVTSMSESINIFDGGGESIGQGPFIDSGTDQIVAISQYFNEFASSGTSEDANQDQSDIQPGTQADASGQQDNQGGQQSNDGNQQDDKSNSATNPDGQQSDSDQKPDDQTGQPQDDSQTGQPSDDTQTGQPQDDDQTGQPQDDSQTGNPGDQSADNIDAATEAAVEAKKQAAQKAKNDEVYSDVMDEARAKNVEDQINVDIDKNNQYVQITLNGGLLFDSGSADIKASVKPLLNKVGSILKLYKKNQIRIIGHTDNVPTSGNGKYPNNMWLSTARATTVFEYLLAKKDISAKHAETTGRGEYDPIASNKTAAGRAKNRRVEFRIYTNQ